MTERQPIVAIQGVEHTYAGGVQLNFGGVDFLVERGQRVAVLGPNGAGKSTLLKLLLGILQPAKGRVCVFGEDPARHYARIRQRIGVVMQNADEQLIGPTVFDDIAFAPLNYGFSRDDTCRRVQAMLQALDITHLQHRLPHYLSGGEKRKVALAGALVFDPALLILDEPMESIDYSSRQEICAFLLRRHRQTGMTLISTMHDMEMVHELADAGYVLRAGGHIDLYGSITDLFFHHNLRQYNLAPPTLVQLITLLKQRGMELPETWDVKQVAEILMGRVKGEG